ncbi:MAG: hypothetical protein LC104_21405 [Bacteroidales bacterium]|nr:hypothetical protein [Bacteroidales bacterium]
MRCLLTLALASGALGCAAERAQRTDGPPSQVQPSTKVQPLMGGVIPRGPATQGSVATTSTPAEMPMNYPSYATQGKFR